MECNSTGKIEHCSESVILGCFGPDIVRDSRGISFSMPGSFVSLRVKGANKLCMEMYGGNNYFRVEITELETKSQQCYVISPERSFVGWVNICDNLFAHREYHIDVIKLTEPMLRSLVTRSHPVEITRVRIDQGSFVEQDWESLMFPQGWLEVIGDSDVCGFGVGGPITSPHNLLSMDPAKEDATKAWGCLLAELFALGNRGALILGASGKGVVRNAPMCGPETIPEMWNRLKSDPTVIRLRSKPRAVVLLVGGNDFFDHAGPDDEIFINTYSKFLSDIRDTHGKKVPIFVFQCSETCASSAGSPTCHPMEDETVGEISDKLGIMTMAAVESCGGAKERIFFEMIRERLSLDDYGLMMHWNVKGQSKIAAYMARFIREQSVGL